MARKFKRKPYSWGGVYKWEVTQYMPEKGGKEPEKTLLSKTRDKFCDAEKGDKFGEDWFTDYVYDEVMDNKGIKHRYAYVACDYVK